MMGLVIMGKPASSSFVCFKSKPASYVEQLGLPDPDKERALNKNGLI